MCIIVQRLIWAYAVDLVFEGVKPLRLNHAFIPVQSVELIRMIRQAFPKMIRPSTLVPFN